MNAVTVSSNTLANAKYGDLYCQRWQPQGDKRAVVLLVHGMGEHCQRYEVLASTLAKQGVAVCSFDLPGHGQSPGTPGYVEHFSDHVDAVLAYREQLSEYCEAMPVFLLGHSMGGLISVLTLLRAQDQFKGCILSGSAIMSPLQPGALQMLTIKLLSVLAPKSGVLQLDASGVSRDPAVVEDYINDPLVHHGKASARLVKELFDSMQAAQDGGQSITISMLIMHGGADSMAAADGSRLLHDRLASKDKTLIVYDDLFHEIFNEPEGPDIHTTVVDWVNARIQ